MIQKLQLIVLCLFPFLGVQAQNILISPQVIASQGQHFQNAQFELSYTIGELAAVSTLASGNSIFTQGFHQPDKFVVAFTDNVMASWSAGLYPNPADEQVTLSVRAVNEDQLVAELLDASGRLIREPRVLQLLPGQQQYDFPVGDLATGIYLLRLRTQDGQHQRTYRFNKSHS